MVKLGSTQQALVLPEIVDEAGVIAVNTITGGLLALVILTWMV